MIRRHLSGKRGDLRITVTLGVAAITGLYLMNTIVTNNANLTEQTALTVQLGQAVENRAQTYASILDSDLTGTIVPSTARACGLNPAVCTTVVSDTPSGDGLSRTLRIQADQVDGGLVMTRDVVLKATKATHVSSLDTKGRPSWVSVDGANSFTIWGVAAGTPTKVTEDQMKGPKAGTTWVTAGPRSGVDSAGKPWIFRPTSPCTLDASPKGFDTPTDVRIAFSSGDLGSFLDAAGTAYGYGNNDQGQLGLGHAGDTVCTPTSIPDHKFIAISSAAGSTFAIDTAHRLWAWGAGTNGQLGDGKKLSYNTPTAIAPTTRFTAVSTGNGATWALDDKGRAWSWGFNAYGQLGNGTTTAVSTATPIPATTVFTQISAGVTAFYAIDVTGQLWAVGYGANGQLGDGTLTSKSTPVKVAPGAAFVQVTAGSYRAFAIDNSGRLFSWGAGSSGALGTGDSADRTTPTPVDAPARFRSVQTSPNMNYTAAIDTDGGLWAIGTNGNGLWPATLTGNRASAQQMPRPTGFVAPSWQ